MQRILVIKLADIGDLLTATPALRALRATFPHARISLLTTPQCRGLVQRAGLADEEYLFAKQRFDSPAGMAHPDAAAELARLTRWLRQGRFDAALLLHHLTTSFGAAKYRALLAATGAPLRAGLDNGRGDFLTHRVADDGFGVRHEVGYCAEVAALLGAPRDTGPLVFQLTDDDHTAAAGLLAPLGEAPAVAVHPGSGGFSPARRWPVERFAAVAAEVAAAGARVVVVGGPEERALGQTVAAAAGPRALDLTGRTSLSVLGAVVQRCRAFVGNDSGVTHIAAAVGTPLVAVFGPSNHRAWGPWTGGRSAALVLRADLPCSPCVYRGNGLGTPEGCPRRTCLELVTPDVVAAETLRLAGLAAGHATL